MEATDRLIDIIEDHESIVQCIDSIVCAMENGTELPNFVPVLNDTVVSDHLSRICEKMRELKTAAIPQFTENIDE